MKVESKKNIKDSTKKKDITGIILLAFSIILIFAFILTPDKKYVGAVGAVLSGSLKEFLGYICYIVPVVLIWWAITEIRHKKFPFKYSMCAGLVMIILGGSILLHIISEGSGGILGDFSSDVIIQITFGKVGAYIISTALVLIALILMADVSIKKVVLFLIKLPKKSKIKKPRVVTKVEKKVKKKHIKDYLTRGLDKSSPYSGRASSADLNKAFATRVSDNRSSTIPEKVDYSIPLDLLNVQPRTKLKKDEENERGEKLIEVLANFGISARISGVLIGPATTRYEVTLPPDIKLSRIRNLDSNIAMALEAKTVRLLTPIPGKAAVGVEVPAIQQETVYIKTLIESGKFKSNTANLPYCLGKSVDGDFKIVDLSDMPHLLLAGATGSGKSIAIHALINSILFKSSPEDVKFLLIDPKRVELPVYNGIPHLDSEVITNSNKAVKMLQAVTLEMDERYDILSKNNVANIDAYNKIVESNKKLPRIVVVIDELADLMVVAKDKVEIAIVRIAQMARAVGIHLVLATQRPSVDIITGIIKANLPARIAFNVLSGVDSRTILDSNGAEKLLGKGDMLYLATELPLAERLQGCFISRKEVEAVVEYLKNLNYGYVSGLKLQDKLKKNEGDIDYKDEIYPRAVETVIRLKKASTSLLQRRLSIGYNRAARIIDKMEANGIISNDGGVKGREVLVSEEYLRNLRT